MSSSRRFRMADPQQSDQGRLFSRPTDSAHSELSTVGMQSLANDGNEIGLLYVPTTYTPTVPAPLAVMLHGAGGAAQHGMNLLQQEAESMGIVLFAPASQWQTWDVIVNSYGPDVARIDWALREVFARYAIDSTRLAIGGFSDGASYALSLGLTNGDLFTQILAFSPGFSAPAAQRGMPRVFISHGTGDTVLPISRCSRVIVPRLQNAGYNVIYEEFDGPHTVPRDIARRATEWFVGG